MILKLSTLKRTYWLTSPTQIAMYRHPRSGLTLGVAVVRVGIKKWDVSAFEAPAGAQTSAEFFARHSHDAVGVFKTRGEARAEAKKYAARWLRREWSPLERCLCEPIKEGGPR